MRMPWRCAKCGRLLAKIDIHTGSIEIICSKCESANFLRSESPARDGREDSERGLVTLTYSDKQQEPS